MYGAPMVNGAFANTFVMRPLLDTRRCSTTSASVTNASFNSELRDAVARIPITCQSFLETEARCVARRNEAVIMVGPCGPSSQVASKKKWSIATL